MLEELKETPATRYEIGHYKLQMYVFTMQNKLKGERINKSKFEFESAKVKEVGNHLQIAVTATGKSKYLTKAKCTEITSSLFSAFNTDKMPYFMWTGLSQENYQQLQSEISLNVTLVDRNNAALTMTCQ